ncbi:MAG: prolyl oligopeptidase family serine peptidase [Myxococcota bacterium]|nr:prolyl oligopeptidase family serine peptidase [Myxococcota bacterium]
MTRPLRNALLALALSACGGGATTTTTTTTTTTPAARAGETSTTTMSPLQELNARAREAGAVTETLHGVAVEDPYRALESESAITTEWIETQSARSREALSAWTRPRMAEQIRAVLEIGTIGGGAVAGDVAIYSRRDPGREQPALYVHPVRGSRAAGEPRILVDPQTYGERAALDWYELSPSGRLLAFGISENGDERSTLRVIEVATGRMLPDTIAHAKWSSIAWLQSEEGFYYRRYPREGEPDFDPAQQDSYHMRLFFHRLGTDPASDVLVFSPPEPTDFPSASVSDDDRWVVINNSRGWSQSDVFLLDRGRQARARVVAPDEQHPLTTIVAGLDNLTWARVHRGRMYLTTNLDAPRYRIATVDPSQAADRSAWVDLIPEGPNAIEAWTIAGDRIAVHVIDDIRSRVLVHRLDGRADGELELPGRGEIASFDGDPETGRLLVGFSSFVHAPAMHLWTARDRQLTQLAAVESPVDLSQYELTQERVPSRDGTPINVHLLHRRGLARDGSNPVLLTGYGGFNVSLLPGFQRNPLYWVDRGGVFAVANLRGGGELGEAWHRAGNLGQKEHVFEDMEAVIRWLSSSGISRPERIAITGGSNGGLLMGAMITRAPDAFAAAASYVGLYDMVRYHLFPPAELWISEYGSSEDATQLGWLHGYSPYHRVRAGTRLPQILIETADHDTRVHWGHSTKFAARLQEASGEADPSIWFYREQLVGHGAGTRLSDLVRRYVRMYAFVEHALGLPPPAES